MNTANIIIQISVEELDRKLNEVANKAADLTAEKLTKLQAKTKTYTVKEAAAYLDCHHTTITRWIHNKVIKPDAKKGRCYLFYKTTLDKVLNQDRN